MKKISLRIDRMIIFLALIFCLLLFFYLKDPTKIIYPPCPFYYLTGLYCPGCGTSRAIHQLLHGKFLYALNLNPLMVLSIPFIIYLLASRLKIKIGSRLIFKRVIFTKGFYRILIVVIVLYGILRNLPVFPFSILAP